MLDRHHASRYLALIVTVLVIASCCCFAATGPKNIVLLIGDGMGIGAVTAARCAGPGPQGRLAMDTMPVTGLVLTHPAGGLVTDSAAAATALATGVKVANGVISVDPNGKPLKTILEMAAATGKRTGVVTTDVVVGATPAAFLAHVKSRAQLTSIADQYVNSPAEVVFGGGRAYFTPTGTDGGKREDGSNIITRWRERGYEVVYTAEEMQNSTARKLAGLFALEAMTAEPPEPTLAEMTSKALSVLSGGPGFFLMVEASLIDHEAHATNGELLPKRVLGFDEAIKVALDFAKKDAQTLVLVTADHDTGGPAVREAESGTTKLAVAWAAKGHTGNMVAIYAYGPGQYDFTGTYDNTQIPGICAALWNQKLEQK